LIHPGGDGIKIQGNEIAYLNLDAAIRYKLLHIAGSVGMLAAGFKYIPFHMSFSTDDFSYQNDMDMIGPFVGFRIRKFRSSSLVRRVAK